MEQHSSRKSVFNLYSAEAALNQGFFEALALFLLRCGSYSLMTPVTKPRWS